MTTATTPSPLASPADSAVLSATVYVDPSCPFAWITSRWLAEVEAGSGLAVDLELMSLSAVNEGRELEAWYRDYNERAWGPARVAAAILATPAYASQWACFYAAFGQRRHVGGDRDDARNIALTLAELGLPAELSDAAGDCSWDADLRRRTATATAPLAGEGGTPVVHVNGRAFFGPVLTEIPRGAMAVRLWQAMTVLTTTPGFSEVKGARDDQLRTH
ncbi:mycothiol-dependent nitroreductase Rv2466c family protein [Oryzihumus sp.]